MKKQEESGFKKAGSVVLLVVQIAVGLLKFAGYVLLIFILIALLGSFIPQDISSGNIAVIPIVGVISTGDSGFSQGTNSESIIEFIDDAKEDSSIKAILLDIDSPGGPPVATDEIAQAVKETDKPIVAVIRESGASGAFWIATSADYVFANRMSITGSIGVQASHLEFGGFLEEHNVTYRRLTAGKYKDIGTIWKEMTPEEEAVYQLVLDKLHEEFISAVAENRKLEVSYVRNLSTGLVFLGSEAKKLGLIDALGNKKDALSYLEQTLNITAEPVEYSKHEGFLQSLTGLTSSGFYQMGRGIGSSLEKEQQVTLTS